jgi:hypothetical protein
VSAHTDEGGGLLRRASRMNVYAHRRCALPLCEFYLPLHFTRFMLTI